MSQTQQSSVTSILLTGSLGSGTGSIGSGTGSPRARFLSRIKRYTILIEPLTPRLFLLLLLDSDVLPAETPELTRAYLDSLKGGENELTEVDIDGLLHTKKYSQAIDRILIHILRARVTAPESVVRAASLSDNSPTPKPSDNEPYREYFQNHDQVPPMDESRDPALDVLPEASPEEADFQIRPPSPSKMRALYPKPTARSSLLLARPTFTSPHTPTRLHTLSDPPSRALARLYTAVWTHESHIYHNKSANIPQARASIDMNVVDLGGKEPVADLSGMLLTEARFCEYTMLRPTSPEPHTIIELLSGSEMLDRILVTASFRRLYGILVDDTDDTKNGHAVICGQSGIGKSTFISYILTDRLASQLSTILITSSSHGSHVYLFSDSGAYFLPPTAEMRRYIPHGSWILIDDEHPDEEMIKNTKNIPGVRLIQVVTPGGNRGGMLKDMGAVEYWLTPFPWVELYIIGCRGPVRTAPYLLAHSYFTFGPLTRMLLLTARSTALRTHQLQAIQIALSSLPTLISIPSHPLHITSPLHQCLYVARSTPSHTSVTTVPASLYIALSLVLEGISRGSAQTTHLLTEMRSSAKQRKRSAGLFLGAMEGRVDCCAWPYGRRALTDRNGLEPQGSPPAEKQEQGVVESLGY